MGQRGSTMVTLLVDPENLILCNIFNLGSSLQPVLFPLSACHHVSVLLSSLQPVETSNYVPVIQNTSGDTIHIHVPFTLLTLSWNLHDNKGQECYSIRTHSLATLGKPVQATHLGM